MIRTLLYGFLFILFSTVLLAVYVYTPEVYDTLATDAGNVTSVVIEEVQERIPEETATLEEVSRKALAGTTTQLTLADLLSSNASYHCTVTFLTDSSVKGTVLTGQGQARAVFNREIGNRTTQTHVLYSKNGIYVWNDGQNGLFFKAATTSDILSNSQDLTYTCEQETLSSEIFALPKHLTFYTR